MEKKLIRHSALGEYLRLKREELNLSQGDIAKMLGYTSSQFVSNWERGLSSPPLDTLSTLLKTLKLDKKEVAQAMTLDCQRDVESKISELFPKRKVIANK